MSSLHCDRRISPLASRHPQQNTLGSFLKLLNLNLLLLETNYSFLKAVNTAGEPDGDNKVNQTQPEHHVQVSPSKGIQRVRNCRSYQD